MGNYCIVRQNGNSSIEIMSHGHHGKILICTLGKKHAGMCEFQELDDLIAEFVLIKAVAPHSSALCSRCQHGIGNHRSDGCTECICQTYVLSNKFSGIKLTVLEPEPPKEQILDKHDINW